MIGYYPSATGQLNEVSTFSGEGEAGQEKNSILDGYTASRCYPIKVERSILELPNWEGDGELILRFHQEIFPPIGYEENDNLFVIAAPDFNSKYFIDVGENRSIKIFPFMFAVNNNLYVITNFPEEYREKLSEIFGSSKFEVVCSLKKEGRLIKPYRRNTLPIQRETGDALVKATPELLEKCLSCTTEGESNPAYSDAWINKLLDYNVWI